MPYNDDIISASVSEAIIKILQMKHNKANALFVVKFAYQKQDGVTRNIEAKLKDQPFHKK